MAQVGVIAFVRVQKFLAIAVLVLLGLNFCRQGEYEQAPHRKVQEQRLPLKAPDAKMLSEDLPHVDDCGVCDTCVTEEALPHESQDCSTVILPGETVRNLTIKDRQVMRKFAHCSKCHGCLHKLKNIDISIHKFNTTFVHMNGGSPAWIFESKFACGGKSSNKPDTKGHLQGITYDRAIVKTWCLPFRHGFSSFPWLRSISSQKADWEKTHRNKIYISDRVVNNHCDETLAYTMMEKALSMRRIAEACGMQDMVQEVWVAPVKAVMPQTGYPVDVDGLWQAHAKGVSIANLAHPSTNFEVVVDVFTKKINSTQVVMAAIFDLLTSQCDRNTGNVFVDEDGQIYLIDNSDGLFNGGACFKKRRFSSIFLPTTAQSTYTLFGKVYTKTGWNMTRLSPKPEAMLDYRCHAPNGKIGKEFPTEIHQCLNKFQSMDIDDLVDHMRLSTREMALHLKGRARELLTNGFEWTLLNGEPKGMGSPIYTLYPPCCNMHKAWRPFSSTHFKCDIQLTPAPLLQNEGQSSVQ